MVFQAKYRVAAAPCTVCGVGASTTDDPRCSRCKPRCISCHAPAALETAGEGELTGRYCLACGGVDHDGVLRLWAAVFHAPEVAGVRHFLTVAAKKRRGQPDEETLRLALRAGFRARRAAVLAVTRTG